MLHEEPIYYVGTSQINKNFQEMKCGVKSFFPDANMTPTEHKIFTCGFLLQRIIIG